MLTAEEKMAFTREVMSVVNCIPPGKVLTYGDVAALAGNPSAARQVGKILGSLGFDSPLPCHRVVNFQGRTAPHWPEQIDKLRAEGVNFANNNLVIMDLHHWQRYLDEMDI